MWQISLHLIPSIADGPYYQDFNIVLGDVARLVEYVLWANLVSHSLVSTGQTYTFSKSTPNVYIVDFEEVNVSWVLAFWQLSLFVVFIK